MLPMPSLDLDILIRFWSKVKRGPIDTCWPWIACTGNSYGILKIRGHNYYSNRLAYYIEYRKDPGDLYVLHECNNPCCCNPMHLFLGTAVENQEHCMDSGRRARGSETGRNKLWEEHIPNIRLRHQTGESMSSIAQSLGMSVGSIDGIITGKSWRYVR